MGLVGCRVGGQLVGKGVAQGPQALCTDISSSQVTNANASTVRSGGEIGPLLCAPQAKQTLLELSSATWRKRKFSWLLPGLLNNPEGSQMRGNWTPGIV